jgi:hypothetical protein
MSVLATAAAKPTYLLTKFMPFSLFSDKNMLENIFKKNSFM